MKAILLLLPLATAVSCAVPTAVGNDFAPQQMRFGAHAAVATSTGSSDEGGYALGDSFTLEGGYFYSDNIEIGGTAEFWTYDQADVQMYTGFARYYLQTEGNVRPYLLIGVGLYDVTNTEREGSGDVYRLGAGISQFLSDTTSFDISVEEHFSSYVDETRTSEIDSDTMNIYLGFNVML
jgi:outer membrane protein W